MTSHAYAKVSALSLFMAALVAHQSEITVVCTILGGLAALFSLYKGLKGK